MKQTLLIFLLPISLFAAPLPNDEAKTYLDQLAASRPKDAAVTVHFRETRSSPMLARPVVSQGELSFQPPSQFRRETGGSLMVSNGKTLWIYYPAVKEAERYDLKAGAADAFRGLMSAFNFQDVSRLFRFTVEREDGGRRVTLVPKRRSERRLFDEMVLEIGPDQKLHRASWTSPEGERTEMTFSGEQREASPNFDFQPAAGVRVTTPLGR
jgi:outer membrane lipoprotein-sorting protein